jgi:hypothetical protein
MVMLQSVISYYHRMTDWILTDWKRKTSKQQSVTLQSVISQYHRLTDWKSTDCKPVSGSFQSVISS